MQGNTIFCIYLVAHFCIESLRSLITSRQKQRKLQEVTGYLNFVLYISKHSELRYKYHVLHYLLPRVDTCNCCITRLIYKWREE